MRGCRPETVKPARWVASVSIPGEKPRPRERFQPTPCVPTPQSLPPPLLPSLRRLFSSPNPCLFSSRAAAAANPPFPSTPYRAPRRRRMGEEVRHGGHEDEEAALQQQEGGPAERDEPEGADDGKGGLHLLALGRGFASSVGTPGVLQRLPLRNRRAWR